MDRIELNFIDYVVIGIYLLFTLYIGLRHAKSNNEEVENFLLAGRKISLPAFTATLVSTWYGGVLGIGEFTWLYGIINWVTQALPYYLFAIIFAFVFAPRIQRQKMFTIPDLLYENYGKKSGLMGSILIFFLVTPAPHLLMIMFLLSSVLGISLIWAYLIAIIFSVLYVYFGGFGSVVKTDILQFIMMFVGFIVLVFNLLKNYGGLGFLQANLPETHLEFTGGMGVQYVVVWFFIALWTFVDPGFYQRCYAAKSPKVAKYGILAAVGFWMVFDLLTTTAGLYSRVLLQDINPVMAFPKLGALVLPPFFLGVFFVGLLATVMSTLDSTAFLSAVTFGRDVAWRQNQKRDIKQFTKVGLVFTIFFSTLLIVLLPSVVKLWYTLGSILIPALLLPVLITFFDFRKQMKDKMIFVAMLISFLSALIWFLIGCYLGSWEMPVYIFNLQPFYFGLFINLFVLLFNKFNKEIEL